MDRFLSRSNRPTDFRPYHRGNNLCHSTHAFSTQQVPQYDLAQSNKVCRFEELHSHLLKLTFVILQRMPFVILNKTEWQVCERLIKHFQSSIFRQDKTSFGKERGKIGEEMQQSFATFFFCMDRYLLQSKRFQPPLVTRDQKKRNDVSCQRSIDTSYLSKGQYF